MASPRRRTGPAPLTVTRSAPSGSAAEITASRHAATGERGCGTNMPKVLVIANWIACRPMTRPVPRSGLSRPGKRTRSPRHPLMRATAEPGTTALGVATPAGLVVTAAMLGVLAPAAVRDGGLLLRLAPAAPLALVAFWEEPLRPPALGSAAPLAPLFEEPLWPDLPFPPPDVDPLAFDLALEDAVFEPEPRAADWPSALAPAAPLALAPLLEEPLFEGPLWPDLPLPLPDDDPPELAPPPPLASATPSKTRTGESVTITPSVTTKKIRCIQRSRSASVEGGARGEDSRGQSILKRSCAAICKPRQFTSFRSVILL